jgi:hypothetical protein
MKINETSPTKAIPKKKNVWTLTSRFNFTREMFRCNSQREKDGESYTQCRLFPNIPAMVKCSSMGSDCQLTASVEDTVLAIDDFTQKYWPLPTVN